MQIVLLEMAIGNLDAVIQDGSLMPRLTAVIYRGFSAFHLGRHDFCNATRLLLFCVVLCSKVVLCNSSLHFIFGTHGFRYLL